MSDTIIGVVISSLVSLVGIYVTSKNTQDKVSSELDKSVALIRQDTERMKEDIREHNHYAKLFAESMPVVQEQIKVINHRLQDAEEELKRKNN